MPRLSSCLGLLPLLIAVPALAATPSAVSATLKTQLFIAPSGEPFRAGAGEAYPVAAWFAQADSNHDGRLTEGEFVIDATRFFGTLDLNHDDQLDRDEIKHYESDIAPEVRTGDYGAIDWDAGGRTSPGHKGSPRLGLMQVQTDDLEAHVPEEWNRHKDPYLGSGGSRYGLINIPEPVTGMDTDLNGIVTKREMLAAQQRRFRMLDFDGKNYLVLSQLPEPYAQSHASKMKKRR